MKIARILAVYVGVLIPNVSLSGEASPGAVLWTYTPSAPISSPLALSSDRTLYVGTSASLCALTNAGIAASNKWVFPAGVASTPAIGADGTIFFSGSDGNLYALNQDGSLKWAYPAQGGRGSPAVGLDGTVYFQGYTYLHAITPAGAMRWRSFVGGDQYSSPAVAPDGTIYAGSSVTHTLYAFSPTGTTNWLIEFSEPFGDSPAVGADGTVYITAFHLYAIAPHGAILWQTVTNNFAGASPVIGQDGTIYIGEAPDQGLTAVSHAGEISWHSIPAPVNQGRPTPPSTPAVSANGTVYYCVSNNVFAVTPDGVVQWTSPGLQPIPGLTVYGQPPLIASDGIIYTALGNTVYALSGTNGPAHSFWPMYRQNQRRTGAAATVALKPPQKRSDANFDLQVYAQLGKECSLESSTNLALDPWTPWTNFLTTNVPMDIADLTASNSPVKFYRAVEK